ncbi:hypothetical protein CMP1-44 [Clavibacter phage CMP1]|uniref:Primase n=1 Tax=Clavibacter phage CMP1 TaxID=686439 RepID=D0U228_9CAUD|nr:DNA primase [Clavibacter phage CMP1]ACY35940.1 hypothetical protein CMP1-44 [Clavibacter phage CMP1]
MTFGLSGVSTPLTPNLGEHLRDFLAAHWGDARGFATIWHRPVAGPGNPLNKQMWFQYPEEFDELVEYAESIADKDVYASPSLFSRKERKTEFASYTSTVWCDADPAAPENFRLPPSRIMQTREGRWQLFWDLPEKVSTAQASIAARKIALAHKDVGADQSSWPKAKLMRVPGTTNTNVDPHAITTYVNTGNVYMLDDILGAYDDIEIEAETEAEVSKQPVLQTAGLPVPPVEGLPDYEEVLSRIPASETRLLDLVIKVPKVGADGWRSQQRWGLLLDAFRYGFSLEETVALAWGSPVASKWREEQRGIDGLWSEAVKAQATVEQERTKATGAGIEPPVRSRVQTIPPVRLLSENERRKVEQTASFDRLYLEYARSKVKVMNLPLHESNVWVVMAAVYGEAGYIAKRTGRLPLSIYTIGVAGSSSGKSESWGLSQRIINMSSPHDLPWIGENHSENALTERLVAREGKVSVIHIEEAHGRLKQMRQNGWNTGLQEAWTKIYDGEIAALERVGKASETKIVSAIPIMHLIGTPGGMFQALDREMFLSGYLARQLWSYAEDIETGDEVYEIDEAEDDNAIQEYEAMPKYWASQFAQNKLDLLSDVPLGQTSRAMKMTDEAKALAAKLSKKMQEYMLANGDKEIFTTVGRRMHDNFRKLSALAAMSDSSKYVTTEHVLRAAYYMEKFTDTVLYVAGRVSDTIFSRNLDEIETWLAGQKDHEAKASRIYQYRSFDAKRFTQEYLENLIAQGRIYSRADNASGELVYRIKQA